MKHINITNWQGNITDWTKFNYIYGGLDETIADKVNLSIPGTNLRNYFGKSNNLLQLIDVAENTINGVTYSVTNGVININGTARSPLNLWFSLKESIPANTDLYINFFPSGTFGLIVYNVGYARNNWDKRVYTQNSQFTYNAKWETNAICIQLSNGASYNGTFRPMVVYGKVMPKAYEPYGQIVLVENVAKIDLGSLTYERTKWGQNYVFQTSLNDMVKTPANNVNLFCPKYSTVSESYLYNNIVDKVIANNTNASMNLKIVDNAYTDVNTFKSAMNGVYLTYELAEPKVTVFNQVDLGTLEWHYRAQGAPSYYDAYLSGVVNSINVSCPLYKSAWVFSTNTEDKRICTVQNSVRVRDNALQGSIIDLEAKLKGVYLIYEPASSNANMLGMVRPSDPAPTAIEDSMSLDELLEPANEER